MPVYLRMTISVIAKRPKEPGATFLASEQGGPPPTEAPMCAELHR
jgi:hypothetical protein